MASTALPPLNASSASPGHQGVGTDWKPAQRPLVICTEWVLPLEGLVTARMPPWGASTASRKYPKLGPGETSLSAERWAPAWAVAMAISSPSVPFSEATVECIQIRVTRLDLLTSTRSPAAVEEKVASGAAAIVWTPPAQRVAPLGSVHRWTWRPPPVSPIQPR